MHHIWRFDAAAESCVQICVPVAAAALSGHDAAATICLMHTYALIQGMSPRASAGSWAPQLQQDRATLAAV